MKKFISLMTIIGLVLLGYFSYSKNEVKAINRYQNCYNFVRINEKESVTDVPYGIVDGVNYLYQYIKPNYQNLQNGYYGIRLLADNDNKEFYLYLNVILNGETIDKVNAYVTHDSFYNDTSRNFTKFLTIFESTWNNGDIIVHSNSGFYLPKNDLYTGTLLSVDDPGYALVIGNEHGISDTIMNNLFNTILEGALLESYFELKNKDFYYMVNCEQPVDLDTIVKSFSVTDYTKGDISDDIFIVYTDYSKEIAKKEIKDFSLIIGVFDDSMNGNLLPITIKTAYVTPPKLTCPEYVEADCQVMMDKQTLLENFYPSGHGIISLTEDSSDYFNNWSTPGEYIVYGEASDTYGNSTSASFIVRVRDTLAPVISLKESKVEVITYGTFTMDDLKSYISVSDNYDGTITNYSIEDEFGYFNNTRTVATFRFKITATDSSGNTAVSYFYLDVVDIDPPMFVIPDYILVLKSGTAVTREQILEYLAKIQSKAVQSFSTYILDVENPEGEYLIDVVYEDGTSDVVKLDFSLSKENLFGKTEIEKMLSFPIGEKITNEQIISLLESTYDVNISSIEENILTDEVLSGEYLVTVTYEDGSSEVVKLDFSLTDENQYEYEENEESSNNHTIIYWITGGIALLGLAYFIYKRLK